MAYAYQILRSAEQAMASRFAKSTGNSLTLPQFLILDELMSRPVDGMHVVRATGIDRSTASTILRLMSDHGWVVSERSVRDKRRVVHTITPRGRKMHETGKRAIVEIDGNLRQRQGSQATLRVLSSFALDVDDVAIAAE